MAFTTLKSLLIISVWLTIVLSSSFIAQKITSNNNELSRKIVHIGTGPILPLAWWLNISSEIAIGFASLVTIGLLINYRLHLIPTFENVKRKSYGTVAYGTSISLLLIFFWSKNPAAVCSGVMVMAFGDGLAGLIGKQIKSKSWEVLQQQKSLIGTLTMAITSFIVLIGINIASGFNLGLMPIFLISIAATCLEQISPYGIDNLTVPIGVAFLWNLA